MSLRIAQLSSNENLSLVAQTDHVDSNNVWAEKTLPNNVQTLIVSYGNCSISNGAKSKRKHEFTKGRRIASKLLGRFGETRSVGVAADRSPIWPNGFVGSISHSTEFVWVAVGSQSTIRSVGIDTEPIVSEATRQLLSPEIATLDEWLIAKSLGLDPQATFTIVFSAKEAFYKCWYPITGLYFGFLDVSVDAIDKNRICLSMCKSNPKLSKNESAESQTREMPKTLEVFYRIHQANVFSATWIPQPTQHAGEELR